MENNKEVIILRSNPVNPDSRVEKEAISLTRMGIKVKIVCWDRSNNYSSQESILNINGYSIPIVRIGYKASFGEGFKNIIPYLKFQFFNRKWIKKYKNNISVVHACDFDTAFFTYKLCKKLKIKFVYDIFDFLYGEPKNLFQKIIKKKQLKIIDNADATIICTEERVKQIYGSNPKKLIIIHNTPMNYDNNKVFEFDKPISKVKVCYVGILQDGRLLTEIGDYFSKNHNVDFYIGGFGKLESLYKKLSDENENIHFFGKIPYDETLALEKFCDIMLGIYDPSVENHRYAAPNKFYESLFLGKPIVMVKNTGMSSIIEKNQVGVLIDYNENSFGEGIQKLIDNKNEWESISLKMKNLYFQLYDWKEMENRLIKLYKELL